MMRRFALKIGKLGTGLVAAFLAVAPAHAASFIVTYEAAGATHTTAGFDYTGVETFDGLATGVRSFTSDFGGSSITGTYSSVNILASDQYGGAGGSNYAVAGLGVGSNSYSISFAQTGDAGINYFGYWLSALDAGNAVTFFNGESAVFTFTPTNVLDLIGGDLAYYGKPGTGQNSSEPYVFLNFFYEGGTFDRIVFTQQRSANGGYAGYESDNHTVGFYNDIGGGTPVSGIPEPVTWMMMILGFGMVGAAIRRRQAVVAVSA